MRRAIFAAAVALALGVTATLTGCPAAHDDYPGQSCMRDSDCYQGEQCSNSVCVAVPGDLAVQLPDIAHFGPDMAQQLDMTGGDM